MARPRPEWFDPERHRACLHGYEFGDCPARCATCGHRCEVHAPACAAVDCGCAGFDDDPDDADDDEAGASLLGDPD